MFVFSPPSKQEPGNLKVSPIDVNIPDLNAILLDWKPTGPESKQINILYSQWEGNVGEFVPDVL